MAKASEAGRTKTRLCPPLSLEEAARFNTAFLLDIAENLDCAARLAPIAGYMAYGPVGRGDFFDKLLPPSIGAFEAVHRDFGECLKGTLRELFDRGHIAACVLNSDSPTLPAEILIECASALSAPGERIVLGPSTDGGYYLLGCRTVYPRLFEEISWSTEVVARQTLERAAEIGVKVHVLPEWYDVDDASSLRMLVEEAVHGRPYSASYPSSPARHSVDLLSELSRKSDLMNRLAPMPKDVEAVA